MNIVAILIAISAILAVPIGIGLLVTAKEDSTDRALHYATSWCIGLVGFAAVHASAAALGMAFTPVLIILLVTAGAGWLLFFYTGKEKLPVRSEYTALALLYMLTIGMVYLYRYFILSKYPFLDIFQEVHTFGSVYLFEDTGRLDLFSTDSYVPLRQSVYVALSILGISPLQALWILPIPILAICATAAFGLAGSLVQGDYRRFGLAVLLVPTISVVYFTNGSVLSVVSIVLLARLVGPRVRNADQVGWRQTAAAFGIALAAMVLGAVLLRSGLASTVFVSVLAGAILVGLVPGWLRALQPLIIVVLLFAGFALHRGSIVFIPCVLFAYAGLCAVISLTNMRMAHPARRLAGWCMIALAPISLILPVLAVLEQLRLLQVTKALLAAFSAVTHTLLGYELSAGSEMMLGTGPVIALIELARDIGPAAGLCLGATSLLGLWLLVVRRREEQETTPTLVLASWAWTCSLVLFIVISTGLPFAYRVNGLAIALLSVSACLFLFALLEHHSSAQARRSPLYLASGAIVVGLVLYLLFYQPGGVLLGESTPYLRLAGSYLSSTLVVGALFVGLAFWLTPRPAALALALIGASLAFTSDRAGITARMMTYSYGPAPENLNAISFYSPEELTVFESLNAQYGRWLVLSDPVTVSSARALGGGLAFFNYSNLDTVPAEPAAVFRAIMDYLIDPPAEDTVEDRIAKSCAALAFAANSIPSFDIQQRVFRADEIYSLRSMQTAAGDTGSTGNSNRIAVGKTLSQEPVQASRARDGSLLVSLSEVNPKLQPSLLPSEAEHWAIILVVTARTLEWIKGDAEITDYFPRSTAIAHTAFQAPLGKQFPLVGQAGDGLFAFSLACPFAK